MMTVEFQGSKEIPNKSISLEDLKIIVKEEQGLRFIVEGTKILVFQLLMGIHLFPIYELHPFDFDPERESPFFKGMDSGEEICPLNVEEVIEEIDSIRRKQEEGKKIVLIRPVGPSSRIISMKEAKEILRKQTRLFYTYEEDKVCIFYKVPERKPTLIFELYPIHYHNDSQISRDVEELIQFIQLLKERRGNRYE